MDCKLAKRPLIFYSKKWNLDFLMEWHCSLTQGTSWALSLQQNYRLGSSGFTVLQGTQLATVSGITPTVTAATLLSPSLAKIKAGASSASSTHSSYLETPPCHIQWLKEMKVHPTTSINHFTLGLRSNSTVKSVGCSGQKEGRLEETELKIGRKDQGCWCPNKSKLSPLSLLRVLTRWCGQVIC